MIQDATDLPEGTDKIIKGAGVGASDMREGSTPLTPAPPPDVGISGATSPAIGTGGGTAPEGGSQSTRERLREQVRSGRDKIADQAAQTARGLLSQGLERSSEALTNVSRLVGDTAGELDERLGQDYGEYARRAAGAIERTATRLAQKDADALLDDARVFVQQSPGVAMAGAAIVGFALVRLLKIGFEEGSANSAQAGRSAPTA